MPGGSEVARDRGCRINGHYGLGCKNDLIFGRPGP